MTFDPQNDLEKSLVLAAQDPLQRPQFYEEFIRSDIYIIQQDTALTRTGRVRLKKNSELKINNVLVNGKQYLPIFSSLSRIQAVIQHEVGYLCIKARKFLEITKGADLFLNPGSDYGKEFPKEEVERILDGTLWNPLSTTVEEEDTEILVGHPKDFPQELVDNLIRLFQGNPDVEAAYLAIYFNPLDELPPHTLVAVSASKGWDRIISQAGLITHSVKVPAPPVDYIRIGEDDRLTDYFLNQDKPFYSRSANLSDESRS